ncbi:hypothetical protein [Streptomyces sp. S.PB5]|uniref:hypothetical protein n=1 Tax=Streptomyces sp. S.PB5 TaxID=3020844 RepID=UPI0025AF7011|nr:hypothetical protein [Streptomyces sp. S.PB5]MDN3025998.1 hypothetical protein [Streptomyces sp. S.PB5]
MALANSGAGGEGPRPVTQSEAERLAMMRFNVYEGGPHRVTLTIDNGTDSYVVRGLVDYRTHRAVGSYAAGKAGPGQQKGLIAWDLSGLAVATGAKGTSPSSGVAKIVRATAEVPDARWSPRAYAGYPLDTALRVMMALGADRPDNAQLLAQSGPLRLGESTLRGTSYTRISGPRPKPQVGGEAGKTASPQPRPTGTSPLTYWVDGQGELGRLEIRSGGTERPVTVDFTGHETRVKVPKEPWGESAPRGR